MLRSDNTVDGVIAAHISVKKQPNGTFLAIPQGLESLAQSGRDEFEAMSKVKQAIQRAASEGEL